MVELEEVFATIGVKVDPLKHNRNWDDGAT
jgi:hypothetical protein